MKKNYFLFTLGIWIFLIPFLGFPKSWDEFFVSVSGLVIAGMATVFYIKYRMLIRSDSYPSSTSTPSTPKTYEESEPHMSASPFDTSSELGIDPTKTL